MVEATFTPISTLPYQLTTGSQATWFERKAELLVGRLHDL